MEKHEVFHNENGAGPDRGREFAGRLFLGVLVCGTCRSEAFGGGWGKSLIHLFPDASWAAIPHTLASYRGRSSRGASDSHAAFA